ncbi:MAG: hypothetical protein HC772_10380 [Leptolyngbyaceae cyanobacterium CRU_2_3]|nr:hypothetical protein [Leptolyngbyaceae cyanobacterium CRU_2_3]
MPAFLLPKIIAHRGAFTSTQSASLKENTILAFEQAIALGADAVEFDVRSTQDQVLIIHHDPEINGLPIQTLTWAEVTAIDPEIPTLEATIVCCHSRIQMDIEVKRTWI